MVRYADAEVEICDVYAKVACSLCASDMVMFMCSLEFVMDTAGELTSYGKLRRSPPAIMRTLWVSFFCGWMVHTWFA